MRRDRPFVAETLWRGDDLHTLKQAYDLVSALVPLETASRRLVRDKVVLSLRRVNDCPICFK